VQHARGEREGLLRAADDHHLLGVAGDRAGGAEVRRHRLPEGPVSHGIPVVQQRRARVLGMAREQARPDREGELLDGGLADPERAQALQPGLGSEHEARGRTRQDAPGTARRVRGVTARGRPERLVRQRARHERARADVALEVAFRQELLERTQHRDARDPELGREAARGGDALAGA
jgi:hypothetical protein